MSKRDDLVAALAKQQQVYDEVMALYQAGEVVRGDDMRNYALNDAAQLACDAARDYLKAEPVDGSMLLDTIEDILYPLDEEPETNWNGGDVCDAVNGILTVHRPEAWKRQKYKVEVRIESTYADGKEDCDWHEVPEPDEDQSLEDWWEEVVWPLTGSGAPDRGNVDAAYEAEIIMSRNKSVAMQGEKHTWGL